MRLDRRGFLRALPGGALALLAGRASGAAPAPPGIHAATENTRSGPRGPRSPMAPAPDPWKDYPGRERSGLPDPSGETDATLPFARAVERSAPAEAFAGEALPLALLSRLLHRTNGVTETLRAGREVLHLRAAPSAGALYSGEVYVVAERVEGLPPGLYYYRVKDHELVSLREGELLSEVAASVERPGAVEGAAAAVVLTNVFWRYRRRYANRGYRYALVDSGHIGENLHLAATAAGLGAAAPLRFHDARLESLLEVDGREEAVCALHLVGAAAGAEAPPPRERRLVEAWRRGRTPREELAIHRFHAATKCRPAPGGGDGGEPDAAGEASGEGTYDDVRALPPPMRPDTSLDAAIRVRRSTRRFRSDPLSEAQLAGVLHAARGHDFRVAVPSVDLYVAAHRVAGLPAGLYRYVASRHGLETVFRGDLRDRLVAACLGQGKAATAAAVCFGVARFPEGGPGLGTRRYRDQLLEAGAIAQRIYLAAEASGLTARNLAAFVDSELNELLHLDGTTEAVIHLTLVGHGD